MLDVDKFVNVPIIDAYSEYKRVMEEITKFGVDNDNIYLLCCSMMSCVVCSDLKELNPNITILDIGSGFDPIFGVKTRPKQPTAINCYNYYREILPKQYAYEQVKHAMNSLNRTLGGD